jgi:hypothetical protein
VDSGSREENASNKNLEHDLTLDPDRLQKRLVVADHNQRAVKSA